MLFARDILLIQHVILAAYAVELSTIQTLGLVRSFLRDIRTCTTITPLWIQWDTARTARTADGENDQDGEFINYI